jgi:sensor histidine kinase regulating citrate/malate metabolism
MPLVPAGEIEYAVSVPFRRQTLAGEMLLLQLAIVVVVLVAVAGVSLAQSEATFRRVEGRRVTALAEQLAANPLVRSRLLSRTPREGLSPLVDSTRTQSGVTSVTVADADGRIVAATDPTLLGHALPRGEGAGAGRGWSGRLTLGGHQELAAQVPVLGAAADDLGRQLGTVTVGETDPTVWQRVNGASSYLLTYLGVASALGVAGSWLLARRVKRQTLGLEPREIAGLAEHREAMLYGIAEGVVALDPHHRVTLVNEVGRRLLELPEGCVGRNLDELGVDGRLRDVLTGALPEADRRPDEVVVRHGRVLVMNRMTVAKDGRPLGSVTTLRDRTELTRLEQELGSFRSTSELLRAQAHEFANQMHTVSGLVEIGEFDEVVRHIRALTRRRESLDVTLSRRVRDTAVAALLTAKAALAAERAVTLRISDRTSLDRLAPEDAADVATVVGNLVDNAVDAVAAQPGGQDWVEVELRQDTTGVVIVVRDCGPGVAPALAREVFEHGFTTKAAREGGRGIGLALTRLVCERHGGEISVTNTPDGAAFTARMTVSHPDDAVAEGALR